MKTNKRMQLITVLAKSFLLERYNNVIKTNVSFDQLNLG